MQGCANDTGKLIGKVAVLRMAFGCADTLPALSDWKRLGALTTKGFDFSPNSVTSEADDAKGLVENLVTNMDFTISGEGEFRRKDKTTEIGALNISKYIFDEVQAPTSWATSTPHRGLVILARATSPLSLASGKLLMPILSCLKSPRMYRLPV